MHMQKCSGCDCSVAVDDDGKALFCLTKENKLIDYTEE